MLLLLFFSFCEHETNMKNKPNSYRMTPRYMEARSPKVATAFFGGDSVGASDRFCGSACSVEAAKPRRNLASIVLSSESYISLSETVSVWPADG